MPVFQIVKYYITGQIGSIYRDNKWEQASVTFSDYGPGVRIVAFKSTGTVKCPKISNTFFHTFWAKILLFM